MPSSTRASGYSEGERPPAATAPMSATTVKSLPLEQIPTTAVRTPLQDSLRRLLRHRSAQVGLGILGFLIFVAVFAPALAPFDPVKVLKDVKRRSPPCIHLLDRKSVV